LLGFAVELTAVADGSALVLIAHVEAEFAALVTVTGLSATVSESAQSPGC
jgi:hypothetical protein